MLTDYSMKLEWPLQYDLHFRIQWLSRTTICCYQMGYSLWKLLFSQTERKRYHVDFEIFKMSKIFLHTFIRDHIKLLNGSNSRVVLEVHVFMSLSVSYVWITLVCTCFGSDFNGKERKLVKTSSVLKKPAVGFSQIGKCHLIATTLSNSKQFVANVLKMYVIPRFPTELVIF